MRTGVTSEGRCPALAACYDKGRVLSRHDEAEGIRVEVELPRRLVASLEAYRVEN